MVLDSGLPEVRDPILTEPDQFCTYIEDLKRVRDKNVSEISSFEHPINLENNILEGSTLCVVSI